MAKPKSSAASGVFKPGKPTKLDPVDARTLQAQLDETGSAFVAADLETALAWVDQLAKRPLPPKEPKASFLTLEEAGDLVRAAPETVRYWIWQGRLEAFKPGRSVLVRESDLLALVAESETKSKRAAKGK